MAKETTIRVITAIQSTVLVGLGFYLAYQIRAEMQPFSGANLRAGLELAAMTLAITIEHLVPAGLVAAGLLWFLQHEKKRLSA